jgi:hypothetical protein
MQYIFNAAAQALQASGQAVQVFSAAGQALPLLRDPNTGRFIAMAVQGGTALATGGMAPAVVSVVGSVAGMAMQAQQSQRILSVLSEVQAGLGVLQASTAVIGVGTVASVALGAVNLWQTLKLRDEVKQLGLQMHDGFVAIERTIANQAKEVREQIDRVAEDVIFAQHRLELIKAYGLFLSAIERVQVGLTQKNIENRRLMFANAIQDLSNALSIYRSPHILSENNAPGYLRRLECGWQIRQALVISYQLQGEIESAISELIKLQTEIKSGLIEVLDRCSNSDELEFIFPEIYRIQTVDLPNFLAWQTQLEWWDTLSPEEHHDIQVLLDDELSVQASMETSGLTYAMTEPAECLLYREYAESTTPKAIRDSLYFLIDEKQRSVAIEAITAASTKHKLPALMPSVLELASHISIANLQLYLLDDSCVTP